MHNKRRLRTAIAKASGEIPLNKWDRCVLKDISISPGELKHMRSSKEEEDKNMRRLTWQICKR